MKVFELERTQVLPVSLQQAWEFFVSPANLAVITPPDMGFTVLTDVSEGSIYDGMRIDYTVSPLWNIPMRWRTVITGVEAPHLFTDRQERGPYRLWEHTHTFTEVEGGVLMTDHVRYALPLGWLGVMVHGSVVRPRLEHIFDYRRKRLTELFGAA